MRKLMLAGLACIGLLGFELPAAAQSDCKTLVEASPFGPDDQTGATNRVTPAVTKAAAAEIQEGKVITMTNPLVDGVPLFGTRFTKTVLTAVALVPGAALGKNGLTYMEDTWLSQSHVGTHLDGMGHIGRLDCYYNQTPMGKYINQNNMTRLGLEHLKSFATRGVIIDLVKVFQNAGKLKSNPACRTPCIDKGTVITDGRSPGRAQDVQCDAERGRRGVPAHRLGRPVRAVSGAERALQQRRARHRRRRREMARGAEGHPGRRRHLGGRGDPDGGSLARLSRCTRLC